MRDHKSNGNGYSKRVLAAQSVGNIDAEWNEKYQQFLDFNGREPRAIDAPSLAFVLAFFVVTWGLSTWQGVTQLAPLLAITAIVSVASLRFKDFYRAHRQYRERRAEGVANAG